MLGQQPCQRDLAGRRPLCLREDADLVDQRLIRRAVSCGESGDGGADSGGQDFRLGSRVHSEYSLWTAVTGYTARELSL